MRLLKFLSSAIFIFMIISCSEKKVVSTQPETVVVERPAPPFVGVVWVDNEYVWRGGTYVVVPGHYTQHSGAWIPGQWSKKRFPLGSRTLALELSGF